MRPFEAVADGVVRAGFTALEGELLSDLAGQICDLLGDRDSSVPSTGLLASAGIGGSAAPPTDPAIARLLPNAYPDDESAAQEFRHLTEHSLMQRKVANARVIVASLAETLDSGGEIELGVDEQQAWLRALTDIRLVIASRLGIEHDGDVESGRGETEGVGEGEGESETDLMLRDVYDWLGWVQGSLIEALE